MRSKKELLKLFKNELLLRNYSNNTIETYDGYLSKFFDACVGQKEVSIDYIKSFLLGIDNMNSRALYVISIRNFYDFVLKNPLSLEDIPYPRKTNYLPQILSIQEVNNLISGIDNIKHRCIVQLMYSCGLRISEIPEIECNFNVCHIDSDRKLLLVKGAKGFKDRYVPIPLPTLVLLKNYRKLNNEGKWLFMGQNQQKYSVRSIQQIFKSAKNKAKIYKKVTPHGLRHSRITHLCEAGMCIYKLKEFAGHSNIKTTEIYLHLSKVGLQNSIEFADMIIAKALGNKEFLLELAA